MNEVDDYIFGFEGDDHEVIQEAILLDETVPYSSPYFKTKRTDK